MADAAYDPRPIDTAGVSLSPALERLVERLAENTHDLWAQQRLADGWRLGPRRDDANKEHPSLVAYATLPDDERVYDRIVVDGALRALLALGYDIVKRS
ncbi:MAG: RyR domain-containing protein [Vulcanimicrobiaceae bacterium]